MLGCNYIVVLRDDIADVPGVAAEIARTSGAWVRYIYTDALKGFAARIPAEGLPSVASDPRVNYIELDREAYGSPDGPIIESPTDETDPA